MTTVYVEKKIEWQITKYWTLNVLFTFKTVLCNRTTDSENSFQFSSNLTEIDQCVLEFFHNFTVIKCICEKWRALAHLYAYATVQFSFHCHRSYTCSAIMMNVWSNKRIEWIKKERIEFNCFTLEGSLKIWKQFTTNSSSDISCVETQIQCEKKEEIYNNNNKNIRIIR